jgi:CTP:molybdopterin cytidylyltransferase MocA
MGEPKAALRLPGGDTFLGRILRGLVSGGAAPVFTVVAPDDRAAECRVPPELRGVVHVSRNPQPDRGQLSSLQCGLACAVGAPAVILTLVDVPLVDAKLVSRLIAAWRASRVPLVRPARDGRHGHPVLMAEPLIGELLAADPSSNARAIVRRYADRGLELEVQDEGPFLDVDTPEEYRQLFERLERSTDTRDRSSSL